MRIISLAAMVAMISGIALAEIGEPILIGKGRDPAWSPDGSKIAFLQSFGEDDWLMVKNPNGDREADHIYTAPILRFYWLDDSTLATQERKMPAIEGGRLKISRIMKVPLCGEPETVAFDSVDVTKQNDRDLRLEKYADGSLAYFDGGQSEGEPIMLSRASSSDTAAHLRLFLGTVPHPSGKVWLYYGTKGNGRQVTLSENYYDMPKLAPTQDKFFCWAMRGDLVVFDTLGAECANLGRADFVAWAPSGDYITFCKTRYSHYDIEASDLWIAKHDGTDMRQLTDTPDVIETGGIFSPSGRYLAYTNERTREIYVIELK